MKKTLFTSFFISVIFTSFAANETVEGIVLSDEKAASNIEVWSSAPKSKITQTDKKGHFKIKGVDVSKDTIYVDISEEKTLIVPLRGANQLTIRWERDSLFVEREREDLFYIKTYVPSSYGGVVVTRPMLEKTGEINLLRAIALRTPGVEYVQGNLNIRGIKSFANSNFPLYIVDGVETKNVSYLTVMEIETVEILKDVSSSIFGVKGGNGVVVINMRK